MELSIDTLEQTLVRRACAGDAEAYGDLTRLHHGAALRVATVVLGATEGADDVVQQAVERAWRSLDRFDVDRPFRPWLLRIVANAARNDRRGRGRRAALATRAAVSVGRAGTQVATPEELAIDAEERRMVLEALSSLNQADRLVIALRHFEDLTEVEMSEVLGCRPGTVKSRLSRAMVRLRHSYLALAAIFIGLLLATALVVTPTREAIAHWLGIGETRIERVPGDESDPAGLPTLGESVEPATLDEMTARLGQSLPDVGSSSLGAPDSGGLAPHSGVLFAWDDGGASLWVHTMASDVPEATKYLHLDGRVVRVDDLGEAAVAVEAPHVLETDGRRYAGGTVVIWDVDGVEYRLESDMALSDLLVVAHAIADAN
jgi:RNA polymerase sigma-70 factor (ECF subfamily)